ncbi:Gfo/Idh/MocA family protein [Zavarzinella formosa]|uniref:Gfo/Idh/MocA family protein n=1 Tax=Zavarzinella formosa TaxID=360055 RepID=UPI00031207FB|nr:Gfo/Idh/MocA family oxidoreductase [Zavarzinella formosa]
MSDETINNGVNRRDAMTIAGATAFSALMASGNFVHAAESNTINIALIGCGGRGTGAAINALETKQGPVKIVAMADVFEDNLKGAHKAINGKFPKQTEVPPERQFIGFDGYKKAMDCLKPGDVAIFATPVAFRWVHFGYAIEKGLNVFMEKPVSLDGPSSVRMFKLAEESEKKGLKVSVGLMCRHCDARGELYKKIRNGDMGDITFMRAYRMAGPTASAFSEKKPDGISELAYQIRRFHSFLWASGGAYSDFLIHNIDECCWMKDAWPTQAKSSGGRHFRGNYIDQNFDTYSTEFAFADGAKLFLEGRCIPGCHSEFASYAHGTKGSAIISESGHAPSHARMFKAQNMIDSEISWKFEKPEPNPYQLEWEHLMDAIRKDKPHNEARRGTEASLVTAMGRMAAHTGKIITRKMILESKHDFAPDADKLVIDGPAPIQADKDGKYPVPAPGLKGYKEF